MCTELILASIYFAILFLVNYFLFKLLKTNYQNIQFLRKIEKLFDLFLAEKNQGLYFLLILLKKKNFQILSISNKEIKLEDLLILGYTYNFFFQANILNDSESNQIKRNEFKSISFLNRIYYQLLKYQFLFLSF